MERKQEKISFKKMFLYGLFILVFLTLFTFVGCTPATPPNNGNGNGWGDIPSEYTIEGIPNLKQTALSTSFSVAAAMAFNSLGVDIDWFELAPIIQQGMFQDNDALVKYAKDNGFNSGSYHIDLDDTLNLISKEVRIIAQTKYSPEGQSTLARVPFGYKINEEEIYLKDPGIGGDITILFADFTEYSHGCDGLDDWTAVLIYDKTISIDDLNLIPFSYPCYKNYNPEED